MMTSELPTEIETVPERPLAIVPGESARYKLPSIHPEGRKFVGALVMIDYDTVAQWAEAQRIAFTHFRSLVELAQVRALIDAEIARGNQRLAQVSQIRKFHLLIKELDHDDGEVTATMKVRRSSIYKTYAAEIEALYR